ncbi:hypothetical protein H6F76_25360 [Leptolyngbya sp. FACHB-321]|uniref:hypothetical protein n=1 Tax=Leptolyngbya sp. FACHB-321 TaxID=2692807 RepID=UPI0016881E2B|nr:hypothetical protein [Leptolyngbya sp. FACHB-321]MBD2038286.1 hypothetical protein [Leptolyngbya sp. FACHB-321]
MTKCAYAATVSTFLNDVRTGSLQRLMEEGARTAGFGFGKSEQYSWSANAPHIARLVKHVHPEAMIVLELLEPIARCRADVVLFGVDAAGTQRLIVLELKQWSSFEVVEDSPDFVRANVYGSRITEILHPSLQAALFVERLRYWVESCHSHHRAALSCSAYAVLFSLPEPAISSLRGGQYSSLQERAPTIGAPEIELCAHTEPRAQTRRWTSGLRPFCLQCNPTQQAIYRICSGRHQRS